ncbi:MAG: transglutaminase family protein [Gammaproteobacteria bacterium]|nr:transglutaminase family protein [Gammaproteobacteria bacterium]
MTQRESSGVSDEVQYEIVHTTRYTYDETKRSSVMSLCMKPREEIGQKLVSYSLSIDPESLIDVDMDIFGNSRHMFDIHRPHEHLTITSTATVSRTSRQSSSDDLETTQWNELRTYENDWRHWEYLQPSELTRTSADLRDWIKQLGELCLESPYEFLKSLERRLSESITYRPGRTTIESTVDDILLHREGVCQDISQLMIAISRAWGIPSRYVSGYLYDEPGETRHFADNATHAWVECMIPEFGWCSFDPTNPDASEIARIAVGYGRDYRDVPPVKGITMGEGSTDMDVNVIVLRVRSQSRG